MKISIKKNVLLLVLIIAILFSVLLLRINKTYSASTFEKKVLFILDNSTNTTNNICNSVKNDKFNIYILNGEKSYSVPKLEGKCDNLDAFDKNSLYTYHAMSSLKYYVEEIEDTKKPFVISNNGISGDSDYNKSLKPGDKIYFEVDVGNINVSEMSDIRIELEYTKKSNTDIDISESNSISYYIIGSDEKEYGPYSLEETILKSVKTASGYKFMDYYLVSENVIKDFPKNKTISKIRIIPYDKYTIQGGYFRIYNLSISGYNNEYISSYNTISVDNDKVRHSIVKNMADIATVEWKFNPDSSTLHFYSNESSIKDVYNSKATECPNGETKTAGSYGFYCRNTKNDMTARYYKNDIFYGIPYVNNVNTTLEHFNQRIGTDHVYKLPDYDLYLYETTSSATYKDNRTEEINSNTNYKENNDKYFSGLDCSSSTFLSIGQEIPYVHSMTSSHKYYTSSQIESIGGLSATASDVEKYLRDNKILKNTDYFKSTAYNENYSNYIKETYGEEKVFEAYASALPGDIISSKGHVRMVSGYSYVECNDGTIINNYEKESCDGHNGINGEKSYTVLSEIKGYNRISNAKFDYQNKWKVDTTNPFFKDETAFAKYADRMTCTISKENCSPIVSSFNINIKYTFKQLYESERIFMPFRYKIFDVVDKEEGKDHVILPEIKVQNDGINSDKNLTGLIISNYLITGVKFEIGNEKLYDYPNQTNAYSLLNDTPESIKLKISNYLNNNNDYTIRVSILTGPKYSEVTKRMNADADGYYSVLIIKNDYNEVKNIVKDNISDYIGYYDEKEHTINININLKDYVIKYSLDGKTYNLDNIPKYKEIGEYKIYYKISKEGYNDYTGNNYVKIYGIKFSKDIIVNNTNLVRKNNSYSDLIKQLSINSSNKIEHYSYDEKLLNENIYKTRDKLKVILNNEKIYEYNLVYLGDVDGNGKIGSSDYVSIKNHVMGNKIINNNTVFLAADVDKNGVIGSSDYVKIKNYIMKGDEL